MDQPMFSCTRCRKSFPSSQMSRSGTFCKNCSPHHSAFKQCDYCRSDFKRSISGTICGRCQSLKSRYGDPKPCTICQLTMAFGSALVCQRCLHYRTKFGDPRQCEKCLKICAFYKDEASRNKVDGQVLCWVCTYNYKLSKLKERPDKHKSKRSGFDDSYSKTHNSLSSSKRPRTDEISSRHSLNRSASALTDCDKPLSREGEEILNRIRRFLEDIAKRLDDLNASSRRSSDEEDSILDSVHNDHLVTISQLQEEMRNLKRELAQKNAELLAKDRVIAGLRADLGDFEAQRRERAYKTQALANEEIEKLKETIRTLKREKAEILASRNSATKRRRTVTIDTFAPLNLPPLRMPPPLLPTSASTPPHRAAAVASKEKAKNPPPSLPKMESSSPVKSPKREESPQGTTESKEEEKVAPSPSYSPHEMGSNSPHSDKSKGDNGNGQEEGAGKHGNQSNTSNSDSDGEIKD